MAEIENAIEGIELEIEQCPNCTFATIMDTKPEENKLFKCKNQRSLLVPLNLFKNLMFLTFLCLKKSNISRKSQIRLTEMSRFPDLVTPF